MVGRDAELGAVLASIGVDPHRGADRLTDLLIAGDAGVGKSRLLAAVREEAERRGWSMVSGHCLDFGDADLAYLPFSEVVGQLVESWPTAMQQVLQAHPALAKLQPGRRTRSAGTGSDDDQAVDRPDLYRAMAAALAAVAKQNPLILVIDDCHWADRSTRELLTFLLSRGDPAGFAVIVSYRADDLHRRHPLRRHLAEWGRLGGVDRLQLGPLSDAAVRMLVSQLSADRFDERQLGDVVDRAEGNAFFVEELVNAAGEPGGAVPNDLADLLLVRLDRLDEAARQVVRTASVGGRRVSHVLLEAVVDLGANELETALRSAVDQNVLTADRGGYAFRHALLGEAVHDDLLPGERIRLHTRYVRALQDDPAAGSAAGLARHARLAHDWPTAFSAGIEAAREANAVGAPASAAGHYLRALEIRAAESDLSVDGPGPVDLVISAGEALMLAGDPERAEAVLREQYTAMGPGSSAIDQARLLASLARAGSFLDGEQESLELSAKAVRLVPEGLSVVRTEIMVNHAKVLGAWGRIAEAEQAGLEALAMAEQLQRNDLASDAATTLSALLGSGSTEQMRESLRASVERAASAGAFEAELRGRYLLGRSFQDQGQYSEAVGWFESAVELAADRHSRWAPYAFVAYWQLCWIRYLQGDWEQVLAMTVVDDQPPLTGAVLTALRCTIGSARGDDIGRELAGLRSFWTRDVAVAIHSAPLEMILAGRRGQPESIMDRYAEVVADLTPVWQEWFDARLRLAAVAIGAIAEALPGCSSQQRLALRDPIERLHADALEVLTRRSSLARQRWGPEGRAWETRLHAETLRARWLLGSDDAPGAEELITAWKMCEEAFARLGHVHELAVVRTALVGVLQAAGGDQPQVQELIAAARRTAVALGAKPLLERLGSHRDTAGPGPVELTPREGEVLRQVAEGHSNGEIGKRLFIATKTVSVHVSNLMAKLGASSRTEAVAMARRRGLI